ncbi:spermidine/putrescine transport system permease protein [Rhodoligotrophos appendicifer]|uniref:ABC transporter permease n=1 Tax=Rhodoligotrophos appendicifer TaxID=987056 RepID=UPI0011852175|nr:ABC transporter permease [Rhodoligotrophos appendicifer]
MTDLAATSNRPLLLYTILAIGVLYAPILFLVLFSVNDSLYITFPFRGFTTKWYEQMLGNAQMLQALTNSLKVGAITAVTATLVATLAAKAITRYRFPGRQPILSFVMLPLVIPEVILGTSLLTLFLSSGLSLSLFTITLGHIVICTPYALAVMMSRFAGFDTSMEEASLDLGETAFATFWRVTLPLVWPGILASLLLSFLISFDDFVISYFLTGSDQTLPVFIYSQLRFPRNLPGVLALGVCIIAASILLVCVAEWLRRRDTSSEV